MEENERLKFGWEVDKERLEGSVVRKLSVLNV